MDLSRQSPAPTRYVGIGFVVALHLAGIYALSAGLITPLVKPREVAVLLPPPPTVEEPPPPQPVVKANQPNIAQVPVIEVPVIQDWVETPTITALPMPKEGPVASVDGPVSKGPPVTTPAAHNPPQVQAPGAVCSVMPRPEVPSVNWSGEAVLQVVATVRGGRVVGSDFRVLQGALDGKTRRSLQRSLESALAGYQCQGDAMFQQDFAFRLD